jgi:hypothetical protein
MIKREAHWQTIFNQYLREKKWYGYFELKQTEGKSFPFDRIEPGQITGLMAVEQSGLVWKLSDQDQRQKPCDVLSIPPLPAYLVIKFKDGFYMIRFTEILKRLERGEKSISQSSAMLVADRVIHI